MRWNIAVAGAGFVIFGLPLIAVNLSALGTQAKFERAITGETSVPEPIADAGDVVLGLWGDFREGREIEALFVPDRFTRQRSILYTERVTVGDMLAQGETPPAPQYEKLWVMARASQRALDAECPVVIETIGRACAVSSAKVEESSTDGAFEIEAIVGYLPDHDLGSTDIDGPTSLYRTRVRLPVRGGLALQPDAAAAAKRSLYPGIERLCDTIREDRGNCVIGDLELKRSRPNSDGTVDFHVEAALYTVAEKAAPESGEALVGTYDDSRTAASASPGPGVDIAGLPARLMAGIGQLFGTGPKASQDAPSIIRGGHNRYGGSDGRFIPAPDR